MTSLRRLFLVMALSFGAGCDIERAGPATPEVEFVAVNFLDLTPAAEQNEVNVPFPVTGELVSVHASANFRPNADVPINASINGELVEDGVVVVPKGADAGTVHSAAPGGGAAGKAGLTSVQLVHVHNPQQNTEPGHVLVILGFLPSE